MRNSYYDHDPRHTPAEDYSGQRFYMVFKPEGLALPSSWSWLKNFEIFCGFQSKGYMPGYAHSLEEITPQDESLYQPYNKQLNFIIGASVNLRHLFKRFLFHTKSNKKVIKPIQAGTDIVFEFYQHPIIRDGYQPYNPYSGKNFVKTILLRT